jgi:hypothetical protein
MATTAPLPTFLIVGAQKSGTRWLVRNLARHPDVYAAPGEPTFFNRDAYPDLDDYRNHFMEWKGESKIGEATPGYMMWRERPDRTAERIHETLPGVRLVAILRDPIERTQSAFIHHIHMGRIPPDSDLLETLRATPPAEDRYGLISGSWYGRSLRRYVDLFGDDLKVIFTDDVARDPVAAYQATKLHLGIRDEFVPDGLARVIYSNPAPPSQLDASGRRRHLTDQARAYIWSHVEEDVVDLEKMLGVDLRHWRPQAQRVAR